MTGQDAPNSSTPHLEKGGAESASTPPFEKGGTTIPPFEKGESESPSISPFETGESESSSIPPFETGGQGGISSGHPPKQKTILVTGGAGFIGSAVVRRLLSEGYSVVTVDKLTYAGNRRTLADVMDNERHRFVQADIADRQAMERLIREHRPDAIMNLAAETHVDRSIDDPSAFVTTNLVGVYVLLETAREYWRELTQSEREAFRFHHISTDEVFGELGDEGVFLESTPYAPRSPYAASKAGSAHLVRAWGHTYGLPVLVSNCSNNYGPYQYPEKLIPLMILNALEGRDLPVYGKGQNVRDWLYVDDHADALRLILERGRPGETYNIGGDAERTNLDVVHAICDAIDERAPAGRRGSTRNLIRFVADRPGHDYRYAMDFTKLRNEFGWRPNESFESGIRKTVDWYLENADWCRDVQQGRYDRQRLGLADTETT